jgi:hypothetical protein
MKKPEVENLVTLSLSGMVHYDPSELWNKQISYSSDQSHQIMWEVGTKNPIFPFLHNGKVNRKK